MIITSNLNRDVNKTLKQIPMDEIVNEDDRLVEGWASVEVKDSQGEILPISEMEKEMPTWMERGAPIMDTHSNKQVGHGIEWETTTHPDTGKPGIKVKYKIFKGKKLDDIVWDEIKSNKRKGLSWGGLSWETPETVHDKYSGSRATKLHGLEQYEISSVADPANPLALNDAVNFVAKSMKEKNIQVSREAISQGIKTEMEHIDTVNNDMGLIVNIALDHLAEDPDYYTKLAEMEATAPKKQLPPRGTGRLNDNADPQETGVPRTDEERSVRHELKSKEEVTNHALDRDINKRGDSMADMKTVKKEAPVEGESQPATLDDRVAALEESVNKIPEIQGSVSEIKEMLTKMAAPETPAPVEETKQEEPDKPKEEEKEEDEPKEDEPKEEEKMAAIAKKAAEEVAKKFTEVTSTPRPTATPKAVNKSVGISSWNIIEASRSPTAGLKDVHKMANMIRSEAESIDFESSSKLHEVMKSARAM